MLYWLCTFMFHKLLFFLLQHCSQETRDVGFGAEAGDGGEEAFEVERDSAGKGQAADGLPVYAEVCAGEWEGGLL